MERGEQRAANTPRHIVTPNPGGWFDVLSGRSGKAYRVVPTPAPGVHGGASCTCEYFHRGPQPKACSHVEAVVAFLRVKLQAAVVTAPGDLFARIGRSERNWLRSDLTPWPGSTRSTAARRAHVHRSSPDTSCECAFGVELL